MGVGVVWTLWDASSPETDLRALVRTGFFVGMSLGYIEKRPFESLYIFKNWHGPKYEAVFENLYCWLLAYRDYGRNVTMLTCMVQL